MDTKGFLDQLLQAGRDLATQGQGLAERGLGVPQSGPERDAMLSGLGKGAAVAGVLGPLLGSKGGRDVAGDALTVGGLAALGGVAYKAYAPSGARYVTPDGYTVAYNYGPGVYTVVDVPGLYWWGGNYYRWRGGHWQWSHYHGGPWGYRSATHVPFVAHGGWHGGTWHGSRWH